MKTRFALFTAVAFGALAPQIAAARTATVPFGMPIVLEISHDVNSRDAVLGERIELTVAEDVMVDGGVAIPRGSHAVAEICNVKHKGAFGAAGQIETRLLYVRAGDRFVRLHGRMKDKGSSNLGGALVASALAWPAGLIVTGTSGDLHAGTKVMAYLDEEAPVTLVEPGRVVASAGAYGH